MLNELNEDIKKKESNFLHLYKMVQEREKFISNEAKITQYSAVLNFFVKFLQNQDEYSVNVKTVLFWVYIKLGDIYYEEALQNQDNSKYFLAVEYYNQSLRYAIYLEEKNRVLSRLKNIYYYLGDEKSLVKVEETWAENHEREDKFAAYMLLAKQAEVPQIKVLFLEKALDEVMSQNEGFYTKYQDTLNICSQLTALYELLGDKEQAQRIKKLREKTMKLLN
ncbi:MAG: hypothetical protein IKW39_05325 [Alphaproteobacteria bacterium]|nr:hypothetical protein [Alphaproteobacteria bacterium]